MDPDFDVAQLSADRLLEDWHWLLKLRVSVIARNVFGDLFLVDDIGNIVRLEVSVGRVTQIATSVEQFLSMAGTESKQQEWFAKEDAMQFAKKGLIPNQEQCIAFKIPVVFSECANTTNNAYVGNLYEYVSYLGSIHRQIAELPDGSKIKLRIQPERPPE